jgi:tetratricopeptide (TPR) repeat protein
VSSPRRLPLLDELYQQYLADHDVSGYARQVARSYTAATLERLLERGERMTRRAAALSLGLVGGYESNAAMGRALVDEDRGVRSIAESGIRNLWCRAGSEVQRQRLNSIIVLNESHRFDEALDRATALVEQAPWFAEAWNQRAVAFYGQARHAESIRDCQQALEINPYHFAAAAGMGHCYLQLGNQSAALQAFRRALRLNPGMEAVRANVVYLQRLLESQ